ncbi:MAG: GTPase [archaeon]
MNFERVPPVDTPKNYLEVALSRARERSSIVAGKAKRVDTNHREALRESSRIKAIGDRLAHVLTKIVLDFPSINSLPEYYQEMFAVTMDVDELKKSLSKVQWSGQKCREIAVLTSKAIMKESVAAGAKEKSKQALGRIASILNRLEGPIKIIESCRKKAKDLPDIKADMAHVVIFGFPNAGKTTLLTKLTGADAKIAAYAFTTKGINSGPASIDDKTVQIIDTPGTLARFDKMNAIEKIAHLTLDLVADVVIYVFDPTEPYPIEDQKELLKQVEKTGKPTIIYVSKTDMVKTDIKGITDISKLKARIGELVKDIVIEAEPTEEIDEEIYS